MKKQSLVILFFFAWIFTANIHAQIDYTTQSGGFYQPTISSDMPMQQSSFQSSSYYNNTYTVPFAAESMEIGSSDPYYTAAPSGRRNAPPTVSGPAPDITIPLGDGIWFLLICALGAVLRITFKRTAKANIQ